jgi:hypothetical protein
VISQDFLTFGVSLFGDHRYRLKLHRLWACSAIELS